MKINKLVDGDFDLMKTYKESQAKVKNRIIKTMLFMITISLLVLFSSPFFLIWYDHNYLSFKLALSGFIGNLIFYNLYKKAKKL